MGLAKRQKFSVICPEREVSISSKGAKAQSFLPRVIKRQSQYFGALHLLAPTLRL